MVGRFCDMLCDIFFVWKCGCINIIKYDLIELIFGINVEGIFVGLLRVGICLERGGEVGNVRG